MAAEREAKGQGLRLTLPGAPSTPHMVVGVPGWYWPDRPTPVGGPGELTVERARELDKDESVPLELVVIPAGQLAAARAEVADQRAAARSAVRGMADRADGHEVDQVNDEAAAAAVEG